MLRTKVKKLVVGVIAAAGLATLIAGAPLAANALNVGIGATSEPYNQTLYYSTARYHAGGSGSSFRLDSHTGLCGSYFKIALRNTGSGDSTNFNMFRSFVTQTFVWWNGSTNVPQGYYAITARNDCAGMPGATYSWQGLLHLN